jgi:hypothetical protein
MSRIRDGITQATASTEGVISAKGNIGKNKAQGSIDSEGIWDLGIDFKLGGLGITNDYGGAITVSIAGQSITWGREGGKIHYDLGGFEVIVEARDCVVTETKKIMGIVVASHTYPDPGCELPREPEPIIPPFDPTVPLILEDGADTVFVVVHGTSNGYNISLNGGESLIWESKSVAEVTDIADEVFAVVNNTRKTQFKVREILTANKVRTSSDGKNQRVSILNNSALLPANSGFLYDTTSRVWVAAPIAESTNFQVFLNGVRVQSNSGDPIPAIRTYVLLGSRTNCKQWIATTKARSEYFNYVPNWYTSSQTLNYTVARIIPLGKQKLISQPFLQPGVPPHMNDCCEEILDSLEDLKDVLHVDFFKKKKFPIPTYLLAPGCEPGKTTDAENYYHLFQKMFQAIAHNTIVSPQIAIQDADAVKEGDQKINERYLSATGWAEAVTKMLYEIVDDGNIGTNMDIRTGVTVTQLLVAVADLSHKVDCIIDCIGVSTKRSKGEVETSYNLVVEGENTKGFDPKKSNQQLDLNTDISTEKLLAGLLRTRKNPIVKEEIHPKSPTLFEMINDLKNK